MTNIPVVLPTGSPSLQAPVAPFAIVPVSSSLPVATRQSTRAAALVQPATLSTLATTATSSAGHVRGRK